MQYPEKGMSLKVLLALKKEENWCIRENGTYYIHCPSIPCMDSSVDCASCVYMQLKISKQKKREHLLDMVMQEYFKGKEK